MIQLNDMRESVLDVLLFDPTTELLVATARGRLVTLCTPVSLLAEPLRAPVNLSILQN